MILVGFVLQLIRYVRAPNIPSRLDVALFSVLAACTMGSIVLLGAIHQRAEIVEIVNSDSELVEQVKKLTEIVDKLSQRK